MDPLDLDTIVHLNEADPPAPTQNLKDLTKDPNQVKIQGFIIGQRADKMGTNLVSQDRRPVLREFRQSDRYKELTGQQSDEKPDSKPNNHRAESTQSLLPHLRALQMLRESGRTDKAPGSAHRRAAAIRVLHEGSFTMRNVFRAMNGHALLTEDDQSLATNLMVAMVEAGHDRALVEVEVSQSDNAVYVYLDEAAADKLQTVLALLGNYGDADLVQRPSDDLSLGAYVIRVKPKKEAAEVEPENTDQKQEPAKDTSDDEESPVRDKAPDAEDKKNDKDDDSDDDEDEKGESVVPDLPLDNVECEACKSEAAILTMEHGGTLRCASCGASTPMTERERRYLFGLLSEQEVPQGTVVEKPMAQKPEEPAQAQAKPEEKPGYKPGDLISAEDLAQIHDLAAFVEELRKGGLNAVRDPQSGGWKIIAIQQQKPQQAQAVPAQSPAQAAQQNVKPAPILVGEGEDKPLKICKPFVEPKGAKDQEKKATDKCARCGYMRHWHRDLDAPKKSESLVETFSKYTKDSDVTHVVMLRNYDADTSQVLESGSLVKIVAPSSIGRIAISGLSEAWISPDQAPVEDFRAGLNEGTLEYLGSFTQDEATKPARVVFESNRRVARIEEWYNALPEEQKPADAKLEVLRDEKGKIRQFAISVPAGQLESICRHLHSVYEAQFLKIEGLTKLEEPTLAPVKVDQRFFIAFENNLGDTVDGDHRLQAEAFKRAMQMEPLVKDGRGRFGFVVDYDTYRKVEQYMPIFSARLADVIEPIEVLAEADPVAAPSAEPTEIDPAAQDPQQDSDPAAPLTPDEGQPPVDPMADPAAGLPMEPDPKVQAKDNLIDDVIREVRGGLYGQWPPAAEDDPNNPADPNDPDKKAISSGDIDTQLEKAFLAHGVEGPRRSTAELWHRAQMQLIQFAKLDGSLDPDALTTQPSLESECLAKHISENHSGESGEKDEAFVRPPTSGRFARARAPNAGGRFVGKQATAPRFTPPAGPTGVPRVGAARSVVPGAVSSAVRGAVGAVGRGIGRAAMAIPGAQAVSNVAQRMGVSRDNRTLQTARQLATHWAPGPQSALYNFAVTGKTDNVDHATQALQELQSIAQLVDQARTSGRAAPDIVDRQNEVRFLYQFFRSLASGGMGTPGGMGMHYAALLYPNQESTSGGGSGPAVTESTTSESTTADATVDAGIQESSPAGPGAPATPPAARSAVEEYEELKRKAQELTDRPQAELKTEDAAGSASGANSKLKSLGVDNVEFTDESWALFTGMVDQGIMPMNIAVHFGLPIGTVEELSGWYGMPDGKKSD